MGKDHKTSLDEQVELDTSPSLATDSSSFELDMEKYADDVADFDITEEQKRELLETLWSIMRMFVELGFNVNLCEQLLGDFNAASNSIPPDVQLLPSTSAEESRKDGVA